MSFLSNRKKEKKDLPIGGKLAIEIFNMLITNLDLLKQPIDIIDELICFASFSGDLKIFSLLKNDKFCEQIRDDFNGYLYMLTSISRKLNEKDDRELFNKINKTTSIYHSIFLECNKQSDEDINIAFVSKVYEQRFPDTLSTEKIRLTLLYQDIMDTIKIFFSKKNNYKIIIS